MNKWSLNSKIISIYLILIFCPLLNFGQNHANIWYFGYDAGIDFNSGHAVPRLDGMIHTDEGSAVICDSHGNLVAYSDGSSVWNANHNIVNNGSGLSGSKTTTHSAMFVPIPDNTLKYYLFTLSPAFSNTDGVCYSVLDISDGIGEITEKNTLLTTLSYEKIMATPHQNMIDYWVVIPIWNSNLFKTYCITKDGISEPFLDNVGPTHSGTRQYGESVMSPHEKWFCIIAHNIHGTDLYKFNDETGKINHIVSLPLEGFYYGVEFSPDETKLYVSGYDNTRSVLYQYDLSNEDPDAILESVTLIGTVENRHFGSLKLGPDGRIYATKHDTFIGDVFLGVIYNPNEKGSNCNFVEDAFDLTSDARGIWGFPTTITSINTLKCAFEIKNHCVNDSIIFTALYSTEADSIRWSFGDPASGNNFSNNNPGVHIFSEPGVYYVSLSQFFKDGEITCDTTITIFDIPDKELLPNYEICDNTSYTIILNPTLIYYWNNGNINNDMEIFQQDTIWVVTTDANGCSRSDTATINTIDAPQFNLGNDTIICNGEYLTLYIPANLYQYRWQDGSTDPWMVAREQGLYWVKITNHEGCSNRDSLFLTLSAPSLQLAADTLLCDNDSLYLIAGPDIFTYQWNNGSSDTAQWIFEPGIVSVTALDSLGCSAEAQTLIQHFDAPNIFLPPDTAFCSNTPITLKVDAPHSELLWNTGETSEEITPTQPGLYHVVAENRCGVDSDSVWVEIYEIPTVDLGPDTVLFPGSTTTLFADEGFVTYLWNNGFSTPEIQISEAGTYYVEVWNQHCSNTDTINIKNIIPLRVPNVFTPNSDGYNDEFEILGEYLQRFHLTIINRWGETLFESFDINNRWQGTHNNAPCADGVYFWIIKYQYPTMERAITVQGTVTILRN